LCRPWKRFRSNSKAAKKPSERRAIEAFESEEIEWIDDDQELEDYPNIKLGSE